MKKSQAYFAAHILMLNQIPVLIDGFKKEFEDDLTQSYREKNADKLNEDSIHKSRAEAWIRKRVRSAYIDFESFKSRVEMYIKEQTQHWNEEELKFASEQSDFLTPIAVRLLGGPIAKDPSKIFQLIEMYNAGIFDEVFNQIEKEKNNANELRGDHSGTEPGGDNTGQQVIPTHDGEMQGEGECDKEFNDTSFIESAGDFGAKPGPDQEDHTVHESDRYDSGIDSYEQGLLHSQELGRTQEVAAVNEGTDQSDGKDAGGVEG